MATVDLTWSGGLFCGYSSDPINHRSEWIHTPFGPNRHLHDYTGHGPDVWTNQDGWGYFTFGPNVFGIRSKLRRLRSRRRGVPCTDHAPRVEKVRANSRNSVRSQFATALSNAVANSATQCNENTGFQGVI